MANARTRTAASLLLAAAVATLLLWTPVFPADEPAGPEMCQHSFYGNGGMWYALPHRGIVPGSESVRIGTRPLLRGADYYLDYSTGALAFTEPVKPIQRVRVSYRVSGAQSASGDSLSIGGALQFLPGLRGYYAAVSPNRFANAGAAAAPGSQLLGVTYARSFAPRKPAEPATAQDAAGGQQQPAQAPQAGGFRAMWFASSGSAGPVDRVQTPRDPISNLWFQLGPNQQRSREARPSGSLLNIGVQGLPFLGGKLDAGYEDVGRGVDFGLVAQQFSGSPDQPLVQDMAKRAGMQTWNLGVKDVALGQGRLGFTTTQVRDGAATAAQRGFSYDAKEFGFSVNRLMISRDFARPEAAPIAAGPAAGKLKGVALTNIAGRAEVRGVGKLAYTGVSVRDGAEGAFQQSASLEGKRGKVVLNTQKVTPGFNRDKAALGLRGEPEKQKGQGRTSLTAEYQMGKGAKWSADHQYLQDAKTGRTERHTTNTVDVSTAKTKLTLRNELHTTKPGPDSRADSARRTSLDISTAYGKGLNLHGYAETASQDQNGSKTSSSLVRGDFSWDSGKGLTMAGLQQVERLAGGGSKSTRHFDIATKIIGRLQATASYDGWSASRNGQSQRETIMKTHLDGPIARNLNVKFDQLNRWMTGAPSHIVRTAVAEGKIAGISYRNTNILKNQGPGAYEKSNNLEFQWEHEIVVSGGAPAESPKTDGSPSPQIAAQTSSPAPAPQPAVNAAQDQPPAGAAGQAPAPQPNPAPTPQTPAAPQPAQTPPPAPDKVQIGLQGNLLTKNQGEQGSQAQTNVSLSTSYLRGKEKAVDFGGALKRNRVADKEDKREVTLGFAFRMPLDAMLTANVKQLTDQGRVLQSMSSIGLLRPIQPGTLRMEIGSAKTGEQSPAFSTLAFGFSSKRTPASRIELDALVTTYAGPKGEKVAAFAHNVVYKASPRFTVTARTYRNPESKDPKVRYTAVSGYGLSVDTTLAKMKLTMGFSNEKTLAAGLNALTLNFALAGDLGAHAKLDLSYTARLAAHLLKDVPTHFLKLSYTRDVGPSNRLALSGEYKLCTDRDPNIPTTRNLTARIDLTRVF